MKTEEINIKLCYNKFIIGGDLVEYLALYRKYRPQTLDEVAGQEEIKKILANSIINHTITHAYLFSGPRGTGKTTMAKLLAKMVNCLEPVDGCPCGECECCKNVLNSSDIIEIDAASNNGVDEIRELREKANLVPSTCKYKVYIIDEVHMLTMQAFNALLKTLEEPPKHVIFILATTEYHKIPLTITSRCQKFQFSKISSENIISRLREIAEKENIKISSDALEEIAKVSDGGMRDSINLLDQLRSTGNGEISLNDVYDVCGNVSVLTITSLLEDVYNNNVSNVVDFFESISINGKNYAKFFEDLMFFVENVILCKQGVSSKYIKYDISSVSKISEMYSFDEIYKLIDLVNKLLEQLRYISRQDVLVVTNFLKLMNDYNASSVVNKSEDVKEEIKLNFVSKDVDDVSSVEETETNLDNNNLEYLKNKEVIINNTFAVADKNVKTSLQEKFSLVSDYLTDVRFSQVAGMFVDMKIEVAGDEYVVFSCAYVALVNNVYNNYKLCEEFIALLFGKKYNFVVITASEWLNYKQEYIKNIKKGKKYNLMLLDDRIVDLKSLENEPTAVDRLFDIVGEDSVEFK